MHYNNSSLNLLIVKHYPYFSFLIGEGTGHREKNSAPVLTLSDPDPTESQWGVTITWPRFHSRRQRRMFCKCLIVSIPKWSAKILEELKIDLDNTKTTFC